MKFSIPSPSQYLGSLILAALLCLIVYFILNNLGINDMAYSLALGVVLGHLTGSFFTARNSQAGHKKSNDTAVSLYVGNLAYRVQRNSLLELFSRYGEVRSVRIMTDRQTRKPRGYGFVEMDSSGAKRAMSELNNLEFCGRPIRVSEAKQRAGE